MKLRFEPDLDHQQDAVAAVCDLFQGQEHHMVYRLNAVDAWGARRTAARIRGEHVDPSSPARALRPRPDYGPAIGPSSPGLAEPRSPWNRATVEMAPPTTTPNPPRPAR